MKKKIRNRKIAKDEYELSDLRRSLPLMLQQLLDRGFRYGYGQGSARKHLTPAEVIAIRSSNQDADALAHQFGVSVTCIRRILEGVTWQSVAP